MRRMEVQGSWNFNKALHTTFLVLFVFEEKHCCKTTTIVQTLFSTLVLLKFTTETKTTTARTTAVILNVGHS
jgi:hypothetical protein